MPKNTKNTKNKAAKNFAGQNKLGKLKMSILRRWSAANAAFFFIVITIMAFVSYQIVIASIINLNKDGMNKALVQISQQISRLNEPLTMENFKVFLDETTLPVTSDGKEYLQTSIVLSHMINARNMSFFVFNRDKQLIFSTLEQPAPKYIETGGKVITYSSGELQGYLGSRVVKAEKSGQIIGYLVTYYDLDSFNTLRNQMLITFTAIAGVTLVLAVFFGYRMAGYFIRPLRKLRHSMEKVAAHPDETFEPVKFDKDDEIKRIADFYNQMMERVNYYIEQQRGFVSDVSHELRTPLAVIDGHLQLLQRWGKDDPEVLKESLQITIDEVTNMKQLLEDMLAMSRLEQLSSTYLSKETDPVAQIKLALSNFELLHPDFAVSFDDSLAENCRIRMDEGHYLQALTILLDNAAKYSPDSRRVVKIQLAEEDGFVLTTVSDQGMGISEEDINLIFERFFRADKARNREIGGTGLGLAILANIVKQYGGGQILVESELDKGTKFTFKIPMIY